MNDKYFMETALSLAAKGQGFTSPNPMVGAVVVKNDQIVGKGYHKAAGKPHAEVIALDDAGHLANGASLYVTLEPCNHFGKTPPCSEKILESGIKRVVIAMCDPNPDVKGGGIEYLTRHGVAVTTGVCENHAKKLNEIFIKYVKTKRPFVIVKCASTLDGQIATSTGDSKWITGPDSRKFVHGLRHMCDAILVGIDTIKKDDPQLTTRIEDGSESRKFMDPIRIVLDTRLSIDEDAKVLHLNSASKTIIITGQLISTEKKAAFEKKNIRILKSNVKNGLIDIDSLMLQLGSLGITSLMIEGGGHIIYSALAACIVDKIYFFYAPKILGGNDGVPICKGTGPSFMDKCKHLKDISVRQFGNDVMIEGYL